MAVQLQSREEMVTFGQRLRHWAACRQVVSSRLAAFGGEP